MGLSDKVKSYIESWRIDKYTKRRPTHHEQHDMDFYKQNYRNGVYLHIEQKPGRNHGYEVAPQAPTPTRSQSFPLSGAASNLVRRSKSYKTARALRSSETYNDNGEIQR